MTAEEPTTAIDREQLEGLLARRLGTRIRELRLIFRQSGVILRGQSESYHAKQLAQHAAMELADVPILANEIEVP
jgi:hypothetical protein